jgi:hypothetical protein
LLSHRAAIVIFISRHRQNRRTPTLYRMIFRVCTAILKSISALVYVSGWIKKVDKFDEEYRSSAMHHPEGIITMRDVWKCGGLSAESRRYRARGVATP